MTIAAGIFLVVALTTLAGVTAFGHVLRFGGGLGGAAFVLLPALLPALAAGAASLANRTARTARLAVRRLDVAAPAGVAVSWGAVLLLLAVFK